MAQTIKLKRSATASAIPSTAQLALGEIAINTFDGKLYIKKDNGTESVIEVGAGSGGGGVTWSVKTSAYTISANEAILADTSGGSFTVTLPATPSAGDALVIADGGNWEINNLTVARNGSTIEGLAENLTMDIGGVSVEFVYSGTTWQVFAEIGSTGEVAVSNLIATNDTTSTTLYPTFVANDGSNLPVKVSKTGLVFNAAGPYLGIGGATTKTLEVIHQPADIDPMLQLRTNSVSTNETSIMRMCVTTGGGEAGAVEVGAIRTNAVTSGDTDLLFRTCQGTTIAEKARIKSDGKVGIGKTDPATALDVNGTVTATAFSGSGSGLTGVQPTITGGATTITDLNLTASRALVSNTSGKVAVSAVTSTELGHLDGVTSAIQTQLNAKAPTASPTFTGTTTNAILTNSGNVFFGKTATSVTSTGYEYSSALGLSVFTNRTGNSTQFRRATTSLAPTITFFGGSNADDSCGTINVSTTATSYATSSDYRLKENITPITDATQRLLALKPCRFNFIAEPDIFVDGFIAHEAQEVVPAAVNGLKDAVNEEGKPEYQGIDQSKLVPILTAALQDALRRIEALEELLK